MVLLVVGGLSVVAALWYYGAARNADDVPVDLGSIQDSLQRIHSLGRLEPAGTVLQLVPASGNEGAVVAELLVQEGDDVEAGSVLAVLDNHSRRSAALSEAKARLDAAEAKLKQVLAGAKAGDIEAQRAAVLLAEEQAKVARQELDRALSLHQRNALTDEQLGIKQWEYDRILLEQRRASGLLEGIREIRPTDVFAAEKEVATASAAVLRATQDLMASELRATSSGRILKIHAHPGERIGDQGVLEMGDVRHMQAVAEVYESDVARLEPGMPAQVVVDASGDRISGTVREIGNLVARKIVLTNDPVSDTDARVVEVRIQLDPGQVDRVARLSNARVEVFIDLKRENLESSQINDHGRR
jgi:HlyD family secretion protein